MSDEPIGSHEGTVFRVPAERQGRPRIPGRARQLPFPRMTRIVLDARPAADLRRTGVGHYTHALVRHLPPADPQTEYVAWYLDVLGRKRGRLPDLAANASERSTRIPGRVLGALRGGGTFPRVEWFVGSFDLFVATNFVPPPTPSRAVVLVVHDLAFEVLPETAPHHDERWRHGFERWLGRAAGIIVPSVAVRDELVRRHGVAPEIVDAIHHGTDADSFREATPLEVDDIRHRFGIDGPYVLFLGGLEPRKNLETLIRAFGELDADPAVELVIAGGPVSWAPGYSEQVEAAIAGLSEGARGRVRRTGYVGDRDRRALLSGAAMLAYTSLHEGFGFPILEAFAANVPVLTSSSSSMPEVAGDAAVCVDPRDVAAIARGMGEILGDEDLRNVLRAAGTARITRFTWERCARETVSALHRALDRAR